MSVNILLPHPPENTVTVSTTSMPEQPVFTIAGLSNVEVTAPFDGQALVFEGDTQIWENSATLGAVATVSPRDDQTLPPRWDGTNPQSAITQCVWINNSPMTNLVDGTYHWYCSTQSGTSVYYMYMTDAIEDKRPGQINLTFFYWSSSDSWRLSIFDTDGVQIFYDVPTYASQGKITWSMVPKYRGFDISHFRILGFFSDSFGITNIEMRKDAGVLVGRPLSRFPWTGEPFPIDDNFAGHGSINSESMYLDGVDLYALMDRGRLSYSSETAATISNILTYLMDTTDWTSWDLNIGYHTNFQFDTQTFPVAGRKLNTWLSALYGVWTPTWDRKIRFLSKAKPPEASGPKRHFKILTYDGGVNYYLSEISPPLEASPPIPSGGWTSGVGSPEGIVTGTIGAMYTRTDGGVGTTLYIKESNTSNTGWVGK